ncbi:5959_t:CDS:1, partial [Racocetra fulgida]
MLEVVSGTREKPIANTPADYTSLYSKCWSPDPDKRPALDKILNTLDKLSNRIELIINNPELVPDDSQSMAKNLKNCQCST